MRDSVARAFQAYGRPIETVTSFKCLVQVMTASDDNFPVVVGNLQKEQKSWSRLTKILVRKGARPRLSGIFLKAVVQAIILFRLEMWVMITHMGRSLGGLQHRLAIRINGDKLKRQVGGSWEYLLLDMAMRELVFEDMGEYVLNRQNTFAQYIATRTIKNLCK